MKLKRTSVKCWSRANFSANSKRVDNFVRKSGKSVFLLFFFLIISRRIVSVNKKYIYYLYIIRISSSINNEKLVEWFAFINYRRHSHCVRHISTGWKTLQHSFLDCSRSPTQYSPSNHIGEYWISPVSQRRFESVLSIIHYWSERNNPTYDWVFNRFVSFFFLFAIRSDGRFPHATTATEYKTRLCKQRSDDTDMRIETRIGLKNRFLRSARAREVG